MAVDQGLQTPRKDTGRTARANIPVTEVKGSDRGTMGSSGGGLQPDREFGGSAPQVGPGGGKVTSEGRGHSPVDGQS